MELPDYVKRGEAARLIPVISDNRKEQRAASVLLAIFSMVPDFANAVLSNMGHRVGKRSVINTFTEVVLDKGEAPEKDRPDGLIEIHKGKRVWKALVEAKIGSANLTQDQVERYLRLARSNGVDAVITISNQFAARPTHHPLPIPKTLTRSVQLFHISWTSIFTEAFILHHNSAIVDPEQAYLMRELVRFMSDDSVGVTGYMNMPSEWKDLIDMVQMGAKLSPRSPDVENVVCGWHQEVRNLALLLSRLLGTQVTVHLTNAENSNPEVRIKKDIGSVCRSNQLAAKLLIPDATSDLLIIADMRARSIRVSMTLDAPQDKKRASARVRWLLRQLKDVREDGVTIHAIWPSRAPDTVVTLDALREDEKSLDAIYGGTAPRAFEIVLSADSGRRFTGRKTFIEDVESVVPRFYDKIGKHLKTWQPPTPQPTISIVEDVVSDEIRPVSLASKNTTLGNDYSELLDIPHFLNRL